MVKISKETKEELWSNFIFLNGLWIIFICILIIRILFISGGLIDIGYGIIGLIIIVKTSKHFYEYENILYKRMIKIMLSILFTFIMYFIIKKDIKKIFPQKFKKEALEKEDLMDEGEGSWECLKCRKAFKTQTEARVHEDKCEY